MMAVIVKPVIKGFLLDLLGRGSKPSNLRIFLWLATKQQTSVPFPEPRLYNMQITKISTTKK